MELKLDGHNYFDSPELGSNRTFMELKSLLRSTVRQRCYVLIVPLWN